MFEYQLIEDIFKLFLFSKFCFQPRLRSNCSLVLWKGPVLLRWSQWWVMVEIWWCWLWWLFDDDHMMMLTIMMIIWWWWRWRWLYDETGKESIVPSQLRLMVSLMTFSFWCFPHSIELNPWLKAHSQAFHKKYLIWETLDSEYHKVDRNLSSKIKI